MATKQISYRKGTDADYGAFFGVDGEITVNVDSYRLVAHDGVTAGGFTQARLSDISDTQTELFGTNTGNVLISNGDGTHSYKTYGYPLTNDETTNTSQYLTMSTTSTGEWSDPYIATNSLYFNPSTGTLNSTAYNTLSDENHKINIETIQQAVETVGELRGVSFNWKKNGNPSYGVIAQELEEQLPELVTTADDGTKSVNYNGLIGFLIESVKNMNTRLTEIENKLK